MMDYVQAKAKLTLLKSKKQYQVISLDGDEFLNKPYELTVTIKLKSPDILDQLNLAHIKLDIMSQNQEKNVFGIITDFKSKTQKIELKIQSSLSEMKKTTNPKLIYNKTKEELIKSSISERIQKDIKIDMMFFDLKCKNKLYIQSPNESDFDFFIRIIKTENLYYFWSDNKNIENIIVIDDQQNFQNISIKEEKLFIKKITYEIENHIKITAETHNLDMTPYTQTTLNYKKSEKYTIIKTNYKYDSRYDNQHAKGSFLITAELKPTKQIKPNHHKIPQKDNSQMPAFYAGSVSPCGHKTIIDYLNKPNTELPIDEIPIINNGHFISPLHPKTPIILSSIMGDPNQPIIIGCQKASCNQNQLDRNPDTINLQTPSGCTFRITEKNTVEVSTKNKINILLQNKEPKINIENQIGNIHLESKNVLLNTNSFLKQHSAKNHKEHIENQSDLLSGLNLTFNSKLDITFRSNETSIKSPQSIYVSANQIQIQCRNNTSIKSLSQNGHIRLINKNSKLNSTQKIEVSTKTGTVKIGNTRSGLILSPEGIVTLWGRNILPSARTNINLLGNIQQLPYNLLHTYLNDTHHPQILKKLSLHYTENNSLTNQTQTPSSKTKSQNPKNSNISQRNPVTLNIVIQTNNQEIPIYGNQHVTLKSQDQTMRKQLHKNKIHYKHIEPGLWSISIKKPLSNSDYYEILNAKEQPKPNHDLTIKLNCETKTVACLMHPIIFNWRDNIIQNNRHSRSSLTNTEISYFHANNSTATLFIHGYNLSLGKFGRHRDSEIDLTFLTESDHQLAKDSDLLATHAHSWFTHMEDNLNLDKDYSKFSRLINIAWPGDPGSSYDFYHAFEHINSTADKLISLISELKRNNIKINIIAHSLGCTILSNAMQKIATRFPGPTLNSVFYWQGALPHDIFSNNCEHEKWHAPNALSAAKKTFILFSKNDNILGPIPNKQSHHLSQTQINSEKPCWGELIWAELITHLNLHSMYSAATWLGVPVSHLMQPDKQEQAYQLWISHHPINKHGEPFPASWEQHIKTTREKRHQFFSQTTLDVMRAIPKVHDSLEASGHELPNLLSPTVPNWIVNNYSWLCDKNIENFAFNTFDQQKALQGLMTLLMTMFMECEYKPIPALGYEGAKIDKQLEHYLQTKQVELIDQSDYLFHHSAMKEPTKEILDKVFRDVILRNL